MHLTEWHGGTECALSKTIWIRRIAHFEIIGEGGRNAMRGFYAQRVEAGAISFAGHQRPGFPPYLNCVSGVLSVQLQRSFH
jgi:hypothetical protein